MIGGVKRVYRVRIEWPKLDEKLPPTKAYVAGDQWPVPTDLLRVVFTLDSHQVTIDLSTGTADIPVPVAASVRVLAPLEAGSDDRPAIRLSHESKKSERPIFAGPLPPISTRDLRRLPLASFVRAATSLAEAYRRGVETGEEFEWPTAGDWDRSLEKVRLPRGRPERRTSGFYGELADSYRQLAAQGKRPVQEIARRKRVSPNTVRQWIFQARKRRLLDPPSPPLKGGNDDD